MTPQTELLTREEVAARLDIKPCTLDKWRARRKSRRAVPLSFVKIGGRVRYKASDVEKFLELRTITPGEKLPRRRSA